MANGLLCKYCGHNETLHLYHDEPERIGIDPLRRLSGYRKSLESCPGFTLNRRDAAFEDKDQEFRLGFLERQATARAAWGMYAACVRQGQFDQTRKDLERKVSRNVEGAHAQLSEFLKEGHRANQCGFWIG